MKFTGERFVPTEQGKIRLEHYHRYAVVKDIVVQKDVLDLACGEGYGSAFMADTAKTVVGVDISGEAINHALQIYKKSNLTFLQGGATSLDLQENSFDVVVSFETIEHLAEQDKMLSEIRRVLRPQGILVISSPNRPVYSEESGEHNEFHVKELDFDEFDKLLKRQFPNVEYYGQRMLMGSVIQSAKGGQTSYQAWSDDGTTLNQQSGELSEPVYFLAIAGAVKLPQITASVIYPKDLDLVKHYIGFAKWAQSLDTEVNNKNLHIVNLNHEIQIRDQEIINFRQSISERDEQIASANLNLTKSVQEVANLKEILLQRNSELFEVNQSLAETNQQITDLNQQISSLIQQNSELNQQNNELNRQNNELNRKIITLNDEIFQRGEWGLRLDAELNEEQKISNELRNQLNAVAESNSWRLTLPFRETRLWLTQPKQQSKRYAKKSLKLSKRLYQSQFENAQMRESHRQMIAKIAPRLLNITNTRFDGRDKLPIDHETIVKSTLNIPQTPEANLVLDVNTSPIEKAKSIQIPTSDNPLVSVIIPMYGKVAYTLNCLASIAENLPQTLFEVIVIDDCSPDETFTILEEIKSIRLVQNEQNQGFIRSCNIGANLAKGKYLYFLNNDTQVTSGWMDELIQTFQEFPKTGLVGSKLIYPDGKLQEAGGIIWQDGSAWNFGRFQDPQMPVYNYAREVDYCSGASIVVPKSLFDELGGFDEHYLPAYCEDSDLALKIRENGYRVIYQPLSTIIHFEGITSGTNLNTGAKAYQIENGKKLYERWKTRLSHHQIAGNELDQAKDRTTKYRVLVLEHCTPTPNQDAGSVTTYNLLLLLREMGFQVTFIPEDNLLYLPEYTKNLQRIGVEVLFAPYLTSVEQHLQECGERYDLAFLFRPLVVERNIKAIRQYCPNAKILYYTHDLHFLRMSREAKLYQDSAKQKLADEMRFRELDALKSVDAGILVSEQELGKVKEYLTDEKAKLYTLPLILSVPGTSKSFTERQDIVFVGGYQHTPNIDAVKYFVTEIMPFIRELLPEVRFFAVGSNPPEEIKALASDDVIITGFIDDLYSFLDKVRVSVAPLRYGAGIKGKIGTALAGGLPVVATTLATEGMKMTNEDNILIVDSPELFAEAIATLYHDEKLWNKISQNGLKFAEATWGADSVWEILANILRRLGFDIVRNDKPLKLYNSSATRLIETRTGKGEAEKAQQPVDQGYKNKLQQELAIYKDTIKVHNLPEIFHYWSNTYLAPIFQEAGFNSIEEFFAKNLQKAQKRTGSQYAHFVSIGAGNCDLEISVAKRLISENCNNFILECVEINPTMLERGKEMARENNVFENIRFVEADFNTWVAKKNYDGVIANQSLHHVSNLEHLFDQIKNCLQDNGSFITSDIIGRNGHQRWQESLEIVNSFWKELPDNYKFNVLLDRYEEEYINWDCSQEGFEGIRAQDILPLLLERFEFEKFISFGNVIDIFVDRCFGHHFNPNSKWDREFIDRVHAEDEAGFKSGKLTPTHMLAVCVKNLQQYPFYSRGIKPMSAIRNSSRSDSISPLAVNTAQNKHSLSENTETNLSQSAINNESSELNPIATVKNRNEFKLLVKNTTFNSITNFEKEILKSIGDEPFSLDGFCLPCNKPVSFLVDMKFGGTRQKNSWLPNWRERIVCPLCGMNNRQRLIAALIKPILKGHQNKNVYLMEQVTPIFNWVTKIFSEHSIVGSEYLGFEYTSGDFVDGVRHEDIESLSFIDNEFDLIISNDVFEHVPNPTKAFAECARVLKSGGTMIVTIPFFDNKNKSVSRAKISEGSLLHILEPIYHGNPVSNNGSLVFTDFGWDILETLLLTGFSDVSLEIYASAEFGHLGKGQLVFRLVK